MALVLGGLTGPRSTTSSSNNGTTNADNKDTDELGNMLNGQKDKAADDESYMNYFENKFHSSKLFSNSLLSGKKVKKLEATELFGRAKETDYSEDY